PVALRLSTAPVSFLQLPAGPPGLHSFPTRRSSDLEQWNEYLGRGTTFINMPINFVYTYEDIGIAQTWQDVFNATPQGASPGDILDRKSTRLNSSHVKTSYAVFCLKKKRTSTGPATS